jgi:hypothetical protein
MKQGLVSDMARNLARFPVPKQIRHIGATGLTQREIVVELWDRANHGRNL